MTKTATLTTDDLHARLSYARRSRRPLDPSFWTWNSLVDSLFGWRFIPL